MDLNLTRREALGGGASVIALWASTQISAAQGSAIYPSQVCVVVNTASPNNQSEVPVDGCKLYVEPRDSGYDRLWYTVKGLSSWEQLEVEGNSPWEDTDGDSLLELPGDDGFDVDVGKVRTAPSNPDDVVREQDVVLQGGHDLGGPEHNADSLGDLNSKVSNATLDDASEKRPPEAHDHKGETLVPNAVHYPNGGSFQYQRTALSGALETEHSQTGKVVHRLGPRGRELAVSGTLTSSTTVNGRSKIVQADSSGGSLTITLGGQLEYTGLPVAVVDVGGAAGTNPIAVDTATSSSINGAASYSINDDYAAVTVFYGSGGNWFSAPLTP